MLVSLKFKQLTKSRGFFQKCVFYWYNLYGEIQWVDAAWRLSSPTGGNKKNVKSL